jgi:hypothetical protein
MRGAFIRKAKRKVKLWGLSSVDSSHEYPLSRGIVSQMDIEFPSIW